MPITLNGDSGITTPTYGGTIPAEYSVPVTAFKNRLINSDMRIDQRNAGASVTINNAAVLQYSVDRFYGYGQSSDGVFTLQQDSIAPNGFSKSLKATITTADTSIGATQLYIIGQRIEGFNISDLGWGAAGASSVTLSFWVRSSLTGTFGGALQNSGQNRSYPFTYTISVANTWEQKTISIAGDTTGTWLTTNGVGIDVILGLGIGSSFLGTASAWSGSALFGATGQTQVIGTNGATFYITGVQLEKGSTATSFDYRPYGQELALCQRYYQTLTMISGYTGPNSTLIQCSFPFNQMRAAPTLSQSGPFRFDDAAAGYTQSSVSVSTNTVTNSGAQANFANISVGGNFRPYGKNDAQTLNLSAEL